MTDLLSRPYVAADLSACLAIFDSNVPVFFAPEERADFREFLNGLTTGERLYLVLTQKGSVVACGGLVAEARTRQARLAWGMVDRAHHGRGLGTRLTQARLALARATPEIVEIVLATSQHTRGFYEGFGFSTLNVTPDGFAPGLDRWDMALRLG